MLVLLALATMGSTFLGGLFALRFQDKLHLILGFSAGSVIGVAFFDLLPQSMEIGSAYAVSTLTSTIAGGFVAYMLLDRLALFRSRPDSFKAEVHRGQFGAATLSLHSLLDGVAIGLGIQVGPRTALIIALAVLLHDFSDGINTVNIVARHSGNRKLAFRWLLIDAAAPFIGALSTTFFVIPHSAFGLVLALLCGFFLYIGATDLLPESQHAHPTKLTTVMTMLGMLLLLAVTRIFA